MIRQELAANTSISDRQIRRYLPTSLKDQSKIRSNLRTEVTAKTNLDQINIDTATELTHGVLLKMSKAQLIMIIEVFQAQNHTKNMTKLQKPLTNPKSAEKPRSEKRINESKTDSISVQNGQPLAVKSRLARNPVNKTPQTKEQEVLRLHSEDGKGIREISRLTGVSA